MAALTRQLDAGDASGAYWLRADPAHVRPDINGVRLLACGESLMLSEQDSTALLPILKPLFGDSGFLIDAPTPSHWYLRLPAEAKPPLFTEPSEALGGDLFEHMPEGDPGRRWRALANEAQVLLHNHPWNARRAAQGKPPVNSLWFWGGGVLPDIVRSTHAQAQSGEAQLQALACACDGVDMTSVPTCFTTPDVDTLIDLRDVSDLSVIDEAWLQPACDALRRRELRSLSLDLGDGCGYILRGGQRWRFWRRPIPRFAT